MAFRGFLGDYRVKVSLENGQVLEVDLTLVADEKNELQIVVK